MQRIVHFYYHEYLLYNAIAFLIKFVKITQVGNLQIKYEIRVKCYAKQSTKFTYNYINSIFFKKKTTLFNYMLNETHRSTKTKSTLVAMQNTR